MNNNHNHNCQHRYLSKTHETLAPSWTIRIGLGLIKTPGKKKTHGLLGKSGERVPEQVHAIYFFLSHGSFLDSLMHPLPKSHNLIPKPQIKRTLIKIIPPNRLPNTTISIKITNPPNNPLPPPRPKSRNTVRKCLSPSHWIPPLLMSMSAARIPFPSFGVQG